MATFTIIVDSAIDADSPLTDDLMFALRDNLEAALAGAANAPRIFGTAAARETEGAAGSLPVLPVVAADTVKLATGLKVVIGTLVTTSFTDVVAYSMTVTSYTGSIRFKASHLLDDTGSSFLSIWKNGVQLASWSTNTLVVRTQDVSVVPGDIIEWKHRRNIDGNSIVGQVGEFADDGYVVQDLYIQASLK